MKKPSARYAAPLLFLLVLVSGACSSEDEPSVPATSTPHPATSTPPSATSTPEPATGSLAPALGTYFGVNLDLDTDSAQAFSERLGRKPAVYVQFVRFPLDATAIGILDDFVAQVQSQNAMAMITLEPHDGLDAVTPDAVADFADRAAAYNERGVPLFVRFGHEMNGSWYAWGQDPARYVRAFRLLAEAVHERAPNTSTMWAPNYGGGYPFALGPHEARPGSPEFEILDTDHDGRLSMNDDPYTPYYPGDDAVDWVGMSVYHWGSQYPWAENEAPEAGKFTGIITGTYAGLNGDERAVPDFYAVYAAGHNKPMAITETSALYNTTVGGDSEMAIKQSWWRQVFAPEVSRDFPRIKMINWFEWRKAESEVGGAVIDWRATSTPALTGAFTRELPDWLVFAE